MGKRLLAAAAVLAAAVAPAGCATHADRISAFREAWGAADFPAAERAVDVLIAEDTGASPEAVTRSHALDPSVKAGAGNAYLLLLEKAMVRLARGDAGSSARLLLRARDELDRHYAATFRDYFAGLQDDEAMAYAGADYEHILVRVMLALTDLLEGEGDAYAYALQVGEKQEEIIGSPFGWQDEKSGQSYYPRRQYQRVAIGAYVQGLLQEANLFPSEAALAYERGLSYAAGGNPALESSLERARTGKYAPDGCGVLHVFYLGGRGPHLQQTTASPTATALQLAAVGYSIATGTWSQLGQAAVPVPVVVVSDPVVAPLSVSVDGSAAAVATVPLLDVNQVAVQQLQANMPGITARALVRRAMKGAVGGVVESAGGDQGAVLGFLTTLALTATERAETRNWTSLPAQFQVARIPVPGGEHGVSFGPGMEARVRIAQGRDTYAVVVRPHQGLPGTVLVDAFSRVQPGMPLPAIPKPEPDPGAKP